MAWRGHGRGVLRGARREEKERDQIPRGRAGGRWPRGRVLPAAAPSCAAVAAPPWQEGRENLGWVCYFSLELPHSDASPSECPARTREKHEQVVASWRLLFVVPPVASVSAFWGPVHPTLGTSLGVYATI